jgi:hypothetical protein
MPSSSNTVNSIAVLGAGGSGVLNFPGTVRRRTQLVRLVFLVAIADACRSSGPRDSDAAIRGATESRRGAGSASGSASANAASVDSNPFSGETGTSGSRDACAQDDTTSANAAKTSSERMSQVLRVDTAEISRASAPL